MSIIKFEEHLGHPAYKTRTIKNVKLADGTLLINWVMSPGEVLTKNACIGNKKPYLNINKENTNEFYEWLEQHQIKHLNIAGNGIYTMKELGVTITQHGLNTAITRLLEPCKGLQKIRSGGQTGVDEAGAIAGALLDYEVEVLAPRGWLFRDITGRDIANEKKFKERFVGFI